MAKLKLYDARDIRDSLVQHVIDNKELPLWFLKDRGITTGSGEKITFGELNDAFENDQVSHLDDVLAFDIVILDTRDFLLGIGLADINENSQRRGIKLSESFFADADETVQKSLSETFIESPVEAIAEKPPEAATGTAPRKPLPTVQQLGHVLTEQTLQAVEATLAFSLSTGRLKPPKPEGNRHDRRAAKALARQYEPS